jgi:hypothetical protein
MSNSGMKKRRIASGDCHVGDDLPTFESSADEPASVARGALDPGRVASSVPPRTVCAGSFFGFGRAFGFAVGFGFASTCFGAEGTGCETGAGGGEAGGGLLGVTDEWTGAGFDLAAGAGFFGTGFGAGAGGGAGAGAGSGAGVCACVEVGEGVTSVRRADAGPAAKASAAASTQSRTSQALIAIALANVISLSP